MKVIQIFLLCFCIFLFTGILIWSTCVQMWLRPGMSKSLVLVSHTEPRDLIWTAEFEKYTEMTVEYVMVVIRRNLVHGWFYSRHSFVRAKAAASYIALRKFQANWFLLNRVYLLDVKSAWKNAHLNCCCLPQDNETGTALNESLILKTKVQVLNVKERLPGYFLDVKQAHYFIQVIFHVWSY